MSEAAADPLKRTIRVYLDDGVTYEYDVTGKNSDHAAARAREHASAIARDGYRHNDGEGEFVHFPAHRVEKVKVVGGPVPTEYLDRVKGT